MACEAASQEFAKALNAWTSVERELQPLLLSYMGTAGSPGEPIVMGSVMFEHVQRLTEERDKAFERYRAAEAAFWAAKRRHRQ